MTRWAVALVLAGASIVRAQPVAVEDDHPALEAKATLLQRQALALHGQGKLDQALPAAVEAVALFRKLYPKERYPAGHRDLARSLNGLAMVFGGRGDLERAETYYREALAMCRRLYTPDRYPGGHPDLALALGNLGFMLQARGDYGRAEPLYRAALDMNQRLYPAEDYPDGHPDLALALNNMGFLLRARGELARAEPYYRQRLAMDRKLYPPGRFPDGHAALAIGLNNLGFLLSARGDLDGAEQLYREALAMRQKLYPKDRFPDGHSKLATSLTNLGSLLHDRGDLDGAEPLLNGALGMNEKLYPRERYPAGHSLVAISLNNLGGLLRSRGDLAGGERLYRAALAMRQRLYPPERFPAGHPELVSSLNNMAGICLARGDFARAEPIFRATLAMEKRLLDTFLAGTAEAEALNYLADLPQILNGYLSVTRSLPGSEAAAHAAVWDGRGAVARWLGQRRLALRAADGEARILARELAQTRQALAALLNPQADAAPDQAQRLRTLADRKEALEKELARLLPDLAGMLRLARRTPDELRQHLTESTAVIDLLRYIHVAPDTAAPVPKAGRQMACYVAFVLSGNQETRRVELGPAAPIEEALASWRKALADGRVERPAAAKVARLVWAPLQEHLPACTRTVYLVPDGALTQLPWAALPGSKPGSVLLEDLALAVVPHGHFLLEALQDQASKGRKAAEADGLLVAVGGVDYDCAAPLPVRARDDAESLRAPELGHRRLHWPALPETTKELESVLRLADRRQFVSRRGTEATSAKLLQDLPRARWAHLATHGFFADASVRSVLHLSEKDYERGQRGERIGVAARNPLVLSGLVLAGANRPVKDAADEDGGILTAEAIAGLNLDRMELVVLSACETGLGEVAGGEGVFGLQRAFHIAGAKNVIASLWKVDDEATAALMSLFYHNLWQEKMTPLEALRQAQLTIYRHPERVPALARERGPDFAKVVRQPAAATGERRAAARLWAGFVLSGVGR